MTHKFGLKGLLQLMSAIGIIGMLGLSVLFLSEFHSSLVASKQLEVRERVEIALSLINDFHALEIRGTLTRVEAQTKARETIRQIRTSQNDYLWINDTQHLMLMHPIMPELEGKDLSDFKDAEGKKFFADFVDTALRLGSGYVRYVWPKPGASSVQPKLSYVKLFVPWHWIIGSGVYMDDIEATFRKQLWYLISIIGGLGLLYIYIGFRLRTLVLHRVGGDMDKAVTIATHLASGNLDTPISLQATNGPITRPARSGVLDRLMQVSVTRKRVERVNRRLGEALKQSHEAISLVEADLHFSYINPAFTRLFGYQLEEVIGQPISLLEVTGNEAGSPQDAIQMAGQSGLFHGEVLRRAKDGRLIPVLTNIAPVLDEHRIISGYVATMIDLTEIKRVTEQLRENEEKFHAIFDQAFQFIGILSPDGMLRDANQTALDALGLQLADVVGKPLWTTPWWQHSAAQQTKLKAAIAQAALGNFVRFEVSTQGGQGSLRHIDFSLKPVHDGHVRVEQLIAEGRDITERQLAEDEVRTAMVEVSRINTELLASNHKLEQAQIQLLQSEKMASIGLLAAGVAHEINNPIGFVSSNLYALERYVKELLELLDAYEQLETLVHPSQPGAEALASSVVPLLAGLRSLKEHIDLQFLREDAINLLSESHEGTARVKNIVQSLKDFAHASHEDDWDFANIHTGLESTLKVVWNELKYKCEVVKDYGQLPLVQCLLSQLNQVFMNLLINAAQAIEEKGIITIRTGTQEQEVWIDIADTGKGIPAEQLSHIFDPFFTTKPIGKGTGLGLSVSYSIVHKHHGRIEVHSEVGKGSTFRVYLPVTQPPTEDTSAHLHGKGDRAQ